MLPQLDTIQKVIPDQFPDLFTGLGTVKEMYTIKMKANAKPYVLYTPRNVAKVQTELKPRLLTTFLTPFRRFCYNKLPFGISGTPEYFQRCVNNIFAGIPGIVCHVDDVLIFGENQKEHDDMQAYNSSTSHSEGWTHIES